MSQSVNHDLFTSLCLYNHKYMLHIGTNMYVQLTFTSLSIVVQVHSVKSHTMFE